MTEFLLFLAGAVLIPLALNEFCDWSPRLARRIVKWTAGRLSDPQAVARYSEEWAADLEDLPGKLSKLGFALGRVVFLPRILRISREIERSRVDHEFDSDLDPIRIAACGLRLADRLLRNLDAEGRKETAQLASEMNTTPEDLAAMVLEAGMLKRYWTLRKSNPKFVLPSIRTDDWQDGWIRALIYEEMLDDLAKDAQAEFERNSAMESSQ